MVSRRTICGRAFTDIPSRMLYWSFSVSGRGGEDFVATATLVSNVGLWIELRRCWAAWKGRAAMHLNGRWRGKDWHDLIYEWPSQIKRKGHFAASHFYFCFMALWAWPAEAVRGDNRTRGERDSGFSRESVRGTSSRRERQMHLELKAACVSIVAHTVNKYKTHLHSPKGAITCTYVPWIWSDWQIPFETLRNFVCKHQLCWSPFTPDFNDFHFEIWNLSTRTRIHAVL